MHSVENYRKKNLIQHCERSKLTFWVDKSSLKCQNSHFCEFLKPVACGQIVLPEGLLLIGLKLVENVEIKKFIWDIFVAKWEILRKF